MLIQLATDSSSIFLNFVMALSETQEVLKEAIKVFQANDDLHVIEDIGSVCAERQKEFEAQKIDARTCIQG